MRFKSLCIAIGLTLILAEATPLLAQNMTAMEALKGPVEEVVAILKDPSYQDSAKKGPQRDRIWKIVRQAFDFVEIAKRALAYNWRIFTPAQRQEFTELFTDLLGNTYLDKLQSQYHNEKIVFVKQDQFSLDRAVVHTQILRESVATPVDYSMMLENGQWRVYDVNVEGVSLVQNYRTQFSSILLNETPAQLIERLKKKTVNIK